VRERLEEGGVSHFLIRSIIRKGDELKGGYSEEKGEGKRGGGYGNDGVLFLEEYM
jgi:hypothetical protein